MPSEWTLVALPRNTGCQPSLVSLFDSGEPGSASIDTSRSLGRLVTQPPDALTKLVRAVASSWPRTRDRVQRPPLTPAPLPVWEELQLSSPQGATFCPE